MREPLVSGVSFMAGSARITSACVVPGERLEDAMRVVPEERGARFEDNFWLRRLVIEMLDDIVPF